MKNLKQKFNVFIEKNHKVIKNTVFNTLSIMALFLFFAVVSWFNQPSEMEKDIKKLQLIAYNEKSSHIIGSMDFENPTLNHISILPLESYSWGKYGGDLKYHYLHGVKSISVSYKKLKSHTKDKKMELHYDDFQFDDSGANSIVTSENGWTTERYNLVAMK